MHRATTSSEARWLLALSIVARLPAPMLSIGLFVHAARLTGSFATAGVAVASYAAAQGLGGPVLGRWIDRYGQARLLAWTAAVATAVLLAIAALPAGTPAVLLAALTALAGAALPPVGACLRALLPDVVDRAALPAAYVAEATAAEVAFVTGPVVALVIASLGSPALAIAAAALLLAGSTLGFAAQRAPRTWCPAPRRRDRAGALRSGAMRTLVGLFLLLGILFGGVEVAVAASAGGQATQTSVTVGAQLGLWGAGSLAAGIAMTRLGRTPRGTRGLVAVLGVLAAGHLLLAAVADSPIGLAALLVVAGAAISPTYATVNALVEQVAPAGATTEAFTWIATAIGAGGAIGAAVAGIVAEHQGAALAFLFAGAAAVAGIALVSLRAASLAPSSRDAATAGCR